MEPRDVSDARFGYLGERSSGWLGPVSDSLFVFVT